MSIDIVDATAVSLVILVVVIASPQLVVDGAGADGIGTLVRIIGVVTTVGFTVVTGAAFVGFVGGGVMTVLLVIQVVV